MNTMTYEHRAGRRVIEELAALDPRNGVSIFSADLKLLAERPQAPDGGYYLVVLDADG